MTAYSPRCKTRAAVPDFLAQCTEQSFWGAGMTCYLFRWLHNGLLQIFKYLFSYFTGAGSVRAGETHSILHPDVISSGFLLSVLIHQILKALFCATHQPAPPMRKMPFLIIFAFILTK